MEEGRVTAPKEEDVKRLIFILLVAVGCGSTNQERKSSTGPQRAATTPANTSQSAAARKPLFDRLGGKPAVSAVVDEFIGRVAADKRIKNRFMNTDIGRLKSLLVDFICAATGGPCQYTGRDMHSAHAGYNFVEEEFNALVENLAGALAKFHVPDQEQKELLGALGPLKPQIVNPPPTEATKHDPALATEARHQADLLRQVGKATVADLLEAAVAARVRGQRNYAEQLFSAAEIEVEADRFSNISRLFREGAPERITTKLKVLAKDTPPQPKEAVGGSEDDEPSNQPKRASLSGIIRIDGSASDSVRGVVMLTPVSGKYSRRIPKQRTIEQRDRQFAPRIMAIPLGSTVSFPNFDPIFHNVFSLSPTKAFDLGIYRNGESRELKFEKEGFIRLGCNLHANMVAYLAVIGAPHYVVTDGKGNFHFRNVPPGRYKLRAWSDRSSEPVALMIDVNPGENTINLQVKASAADLGTDKFGVARGPAR
jgi:hemoglobin